MLSREHRAQLHDIARQTLEEWVRRRKRPSFDIADEPLAEPRGVFVTLKKRGELQGCIGLVEPLLPLHEAVRNMTCSAATGDPRFDGVRPHDLPDITIELSVLSVPAPVPVPHGVVVGRHGLIVRNGSRSGLLLPQVAVEHAWDAEAFLDNTCWKAGLPPGCWRDDNTEILAFTAEVF